MQWNNKIGGLISRFRVLALLIIFFGLFCSEIKAQEKAKINRSEFKVMTKGFKEAWKDLKDAEILFEKGEEYYSLALAKYLKAYKYNPAYPFLNYRIGVCFLHTTPKSESVHFLTKAYKIDTLVSRDILFRIARAYHLNYEFSTAIVFYVKYQYQFSKEEKKIFLPQVTKLIEECHNGIELMKKPKRVFVENAGVNINSPNIDHIPLVSPDQSILIFTSKRKLDRVDKKAGSPTYSEDIYISKKLSGKWQKAIAAPAPLNSNHNESAISLSPDGQTLYLYREDKKGDIFYSVLNGQKWSTPKAFQRKINTKYDEPSLSFSYDMQTLFFISDRKDISLGNKDIFYSKKHPRKNKWGKVNNIGYPLNTAFNEGDVFIHPDGKTLFFSSEGHNSMGGFDIFKSVYDKKKGWSKPENLGYPINTPSDDHFFMLSADGRTAYFTSTRDGGIGQKDIYIATFLDVDKKQMMSTEDNLVLSLSQPVKETLINPEIKFETRKLTLLKGKVADQNTFQPIEASIKIVDNRTGKIIRQMKNNAKNGKFTIPLPFGKNYGIFILSPGYLYFSDRVFVENSDSASFHEKILDVKLQKLERGAKIVLNNVGFIPGSLNLRKTSTYEINLIKRILNENPTLKVLFLGHTDNLGTLRQNADISEKKAKIIVRLLEDKGVENARMEFHGCAYLKPISDNRTKEGREKNRRIEMQILEN